MTKRQFSYKPADDFRAIVAQLGYALTELAIECNLARDSITKMVTRERVSPKNALKIAAVLAPKLRMKPQAALRRLFVNTDGSPIPQLPTTPIEPAEPAK